MRDTQKHAHFRRGRIQLSHAIEPRATAGSDVGRRILEAAVQAAAHNVRVARNKGDWPAVEDLLEACAAHFLDKFRAAEKEEEEEEGSRRRR